MIDSFDQRKRNVLANLESPCGDKSRKGSVDAPIASLCSKINSQSGIYTTSSCSGRISVFAEPDSLSRSQGKKGGEWVYASHDRAVEEEVLARIMDRKAAGSLVLRFEPFILHAECRTLDEASRVLLAARNAGYRESGATLGNRVMLAIRCSLRLEVPVADGGEMLVPESYLRYLIRLANEKFKENEDRVMKLEAQLDLIWGRTVGPSEPHPTPSPGAIIANGKGQLQVTKAFRQSQGLDVVPTRPRNASEGSVDPRKLLLGRQLSILKRIKALEKSQLSSPGSIGSRREDLTLPVVQEESSRREDPPLPVFQSESKEMSKDPGLHWNELLLDSEKSSPSVSRWGHASVLLPNGSICIIGGYGGHGVTHTRMADVVIISMSREVGEGKAVGQMKVAQTRAADDGQGVMQARQGHSATLIDESRILVVGGRSSPAEAFDDIWILDTEKWTWTRPKIKINGEPGRDSLNRVPSGRYRHSATSIETQEGLRGVVVFGGRDGSGSLLDDLWFIEASHDDLMTVACTFVPPSSLEPSSWPSPRKSHAMAATAIKDGRDGRIYLYGGAGSYGEHYDDLFCLDFSQISSFLDGKAPGVTWRKVEAVGSAPPPCFSHTLTFSSHHQRLYLIGGHPGSHHSSLYSFDTKQETWENKFLSKTTTDFVPVRHTSHLCGNHLIVIGGGAFCFSFGTIFSSVWMMHLEAGRQDNSRMTSSSLEVNLSSNENVAQGGFLALQVPLNLAKAVKDDLKSCGWLDRLVKVEVMDGCVILPLISSNASQAIASKDHSCVPPAIIEAMDNGAKLVQGRKMHANTKANHQDPKAIMRSTVALALKDRESNVSDNLLAELLADLPAKWEKLGDLALIPASSVSHPGWMHLSVDMEVIWLVIAKAIGVKRLARQQPIANTGTRDSMAKMLLGSDGWVCHKEGRVNYNLDVTKCMFSSGNCSERIRMGKLPSSGQVIVDLFCGIGYFTLSFLINGGASKVYACDWNPNAIIALRKNLSANHVSSERCEVLEGDCRIVAPKGVADRVSLGLIPSSRIGWEAAVASLKPSSGGWLHVHYNVRDSEVDAWSKEAARKLEKIAHGMGRDGWRARVEHVERVKSYAPHILHIVVDMFLGPPPLNPPSPPPSHVQNVPSIPSANNRLFTFDSLPRIETVDANGKDRDWFEKKISKERKPVLLSGLDLGPCVEKWTMDSLLSLPSSQCTLVSVHVTDDNEGALDFVNKNFSFQTMTLSDLVSHVSSPILANRRYYLRSIGVNPRKEPANLSESFPDLSPDVSLPLHLIPEGSLFSTVLRISSPGIRLWTHYDVMDNFLIQVMGRKRVLLWPPCEHDNLYIEGSSSPIIRINDPSVLQRYPKFASASTPIACLLEPGDVLFIPSLWFHNVSSDHDGPTVSINSFFRHLPDAHYEKKDLYGNKDLIEANVADAFVDKAIESLDQLPEHYRTFYLERALHRMQKRR